MNSIARNCIIHGTTCHLLPDLVEAPVTHRVPDTRIIRANDAPLRPERDFVLYWMIASRRTHYNFGLQRAAELASELDKPVVVFEALRTHYPWACDRFHHFVIEGMAENARALADQRVLYAPYVEPELDAGKGLIEALGSHACAVVTDDYPAFMLPNMTAAAAEQLDVVLEKIDSNGLYPMRSAEREFTRAHSFRRHLHKELKPHLQAFPKRDPLSGYALEVLQELPASITDRWAMTPIESLESPSNLIDSLPLNHSISKCDVVGGSAGARNAFEHFLDHNLERYADGRNHPDDDASSRLSPWLHFGHISSYEVFERLVERENWTPDQTSADCIGKREGWWQMSEAVESFLDEIITWREIGFNTCVMRPDDYDDYDSLPDWALKTLAEHADDPREHVYTLEEFDAAKTHDSLWNAAQNQLRVEGRIHNYLRMLWGKKILHWTPSPREALEIMIELNNRYALDGRDPNSYSGIFWVLGRHDRAWGPERPIFGKIRYMTTKSARSKLRLKDYEARWTESGQMTLPC